MIPSRLRALFPAVALILFSLGARPARAWDEWADKVIDFSTQYSTSSYSAAQTLDMPDVTSYGDDANAWAPKYQNGTTEYVTVGFLEPLYADSVTIRENLGNGFVTKVETVDASNTYRTVWNGTDTSQPGALADFTPTWTRTSYLVTGVRITVNTSHSSDWEEIDAIQLHGLTSGVLQWASSVLDVSSEYGTPPGDWSAAQALGVPDVPKYGDSVKAWAPGSANSGMQYITLGFAQPVFATGVAVRETDGNGFITRIDALDAAGVYHQVWTGTDQARPQMPDFFSAFWPQTDYPVQGVKIYVDTDHTTGWEEIDAAYLRGVSASAPTPVITGIDPNTAFRESPDTTVTVTGSNFLNSSVVNWNGSPLATTYVSASELTAVIPAANLATPGTANITVTTPTAAGPSNVAAFTITQDYVQWASIVIDASSQYGTGSLSYSAQQALGPPDTATYGDHGTAWTSREKDMGVQTLTLGFSRAVYADGALIRETNSNGFITKIEALDTTGTYHTVWTGTDPSQPGAPVDYNVPFAQTAYPVRGLRLSIDTNHAVDNWEEIDAVRLQGVPVTAPAPSITKLGPNPALLASPPFTLVVTGTGFQPNSVVRWNGADRATTFISPTVLTAAIPVTDSATAVSAAITVFTPAPGGGTSPAMTLAFGPARYGDVDGNGKMELADVFAALRVSAGLQKFASLNGGDVAPAYPASPDGYGDARINVQDALRILRALHNM